MRPTLEDGDLCAIDYTVTWFAGNGIYLIDYRDGLAQQVKRIIKPHPFSERLVVVSDNGDYDSFDFDQERQSIAGRVIQSHRITEH